MSIQTIFLVLLGAAVFVAGTTNIRAYLRLQKPGNVMDGKVLSSRLVRKRDNEGRLIQHYYELTVQCPAGGKNCNQNINSTMEYEKGDEIKLAKNGDKTVILSGKSMTFGTALAITLAGMGMAVFPVVYQNSGEKAGSVILVILLLLGGTVTLSSFIRDRKRTLAALEGEIIDILYYRTGERKKFSRPVESYYPLMKCSIHGKERTFLSSYSSNTKGTYKVGAKVKLFYDEVYRDIVERKASPVLAVAAGIFWLLALVGLLSIFGR